MARWCNLSCPRKALEEHGNVKWQKLSNVKWRITTMTRLQTWADVEICRKCQLGFKWRDANRHLHVYGRSEGRDACKGTSESSHIGSSLIARSLNQLAWLNQAHNGAEDMHRMRCTPIFKSFWYYYTLYLLEIGIITYCIFSLEKEALEVERNTGSRLGGIRAWNQEIIFYVRIC